MELLLSCSLSVKFLDANETPESLGRHEKPVWGSKHLYLTLDRWRAFEVVHNIFKTREEVDLVPLSLSSTS